MKPILYLICIPHSVLSSHLCSTFDHTLKVNKNFTVFVHSDTYTVIARNLCLQYHSTILMKDAELNLKEKITPTECGNTNDEHNNDSKMEWDFKSHSRGQNSRERKQQNQCLAITVALAVINEPADRTLEVDA